MNYTRFFSPDVKDQGVCLSCWAITTVEIIESLLKRKGRDWRLSVQNLVDCSVLNYGCNGGWASFAYMYVRDEGVSNGSSYVYVGAKQECKRVGKQFPAIAKVIDFCEIKVNGKEEILKKILAKYGPVSAAMCEKDIDKDKRGFFTQSKYF